MPKSRTSLFVIGILIAMLAASLLTVLGLYLAGAIVVNPVELVFSVSAVDPKEYDGTPLRAKNYTWDSGELREGHKLEARLFGEQIESGSSETDLQVKVLDEKKNDVTDKYSIKVNNATLTVLKRSLTVLLKPQQIPYSGSKIAIEEYDIYKGIDLAGLVSSFEEGELVAGHKLVVSFPDQFENVGDTLPAVDDWKDENFLVYDAAGNDVSANYRLQGNMVAGGSIEIVPRRLSVKALNVEKYYDGAPVEGKYELVDGTLVSGHYIGEVQFTDMHGESVSVVRAGESATVRVSAITVYEQVGFDLVPLDEELQKNYELNISSNLNGTLSVKRRPLTVRAKNLIKTYDGLPLNSILNDDEPEYTADLPEGFKITQSTSVAGTLTDVYDGFYSIDDVRIVSERDNVTVTEQFDIVYLPATAKISPVRLQCDVRSFSEDYTGREISIGAEDAIGETLEKTIDAYIADNDLDPSFQQRLAELKMLFTAERQPYFRAVPDKIVKNAGEYGYTMEFTEYGKALFGKDGNVVFQFSTGRFTVNRVRIAVQYYDSRAAVTEIRKFYDGTEADLDYRNLLVDGSTNLSVTGADFRYVTDGDASDLRNHALTNVYTVKVSAVRIYDTTTLTDVSDNYLVDAPTLTVRIYAANLTATSGQSVITYEVENIPTGSELTTLMANLREQFRSSIGFSGLAAGDTVSYDADEGFTLDSYFDARTNTIIFSVVFESNMIITNSKGEDVTNCYTLTNEGSTVVTVYLNEKGA